MQHASNSKDELIFSERGYRKIRWKFTWSATLDVDIIRDEYGKEYCRCFRVFELYHSMMGAQSMKDVILSTPPLIIPFYDICGFRYQLKREV